MTAARASPSLVSCAPSGPSNCIAWTSTSSPEQMPTQMQWCGGTFTTKAQRLCGDSIAPVMISNHSLLHICSTRPYLCKSSVYLEPHQTHHPRPGHCHTERAVLLQSGRDTLYALGADVSIIEAEARQRDVLRTNMSVSASLAVRAATTCPSPTADTR
jgi:hypothetical protein